MASLNSYALVGSHIGELSVTVLSEGHGLSEASVQVLDEETEAVIATGLTDSAGSTVVRGLPAGNYLIRTTRLGFVPTFFGQLQPSWPPRPVSFNPSRDLLDLQISVARMSSISGTVLLLGHRTGGIIISAAGCDDTTSELICRRDGPSTKTDASGNYRLDGLVPGRYLVVAIPPKTGVLSPSGQQAGAPAILAPTYFPGSVSVRDATPLSVPIATDVRSADIYVESQLGGSISGSIMAPPGDNSEDILFDVSVTDAAVPSFSFSRSVAIRRNGSFQFDAVVPGEYYVVARVANGAVRDFASPFWTSAKVLVRPGLTESVVLFTQRTITVSGFVEDRGLQSSSVPTSVSLTRLGKNLPGAGPFLVEVDKKGRFLASGIPIGTYRLGLHGNSTYSGVDVVAPLLASGADSAAFEVSSEDGRQLELIAKYSSRPTTVFGRVDAGEAFVFVFPVSKTYWKPSSRRIQVVQTDTSGGYRVRQLDEGEYFILAIASGEPQRLFDVDYLETLVRTQPRVISLTTSAPVNVDLSRRKDD